MSRAIALPYPLIYRFNISLNRSVSFGSTFSACLSPEIKMSAIVNITWMHLIVSYCTRGKSIPFG